MDLDFIIQFLQFLVLMVLNVQYEDSLGNCTTHCAKVKNFLQGIKFQPRQISKELSCCKSTFLHFDTLHVSQDFLLSKSVHL
jgi:hypothetical protein